MGGCRFLDYGKVLKIPTLKKLIIDATSVSLLDKCSDNVEDLTFIFASVFVSSRPLVVPDNLICPKLKNLVFDKYCPPNWKFIMNQSSTLKTLVILGFLSIKEERGLEEQT